MEKEFAYASDNDPPSDYRLGKLQHATRHNHLSAFGNADVAIREVFTYGGIGGRVSKRETQRADDPEPPDPFDPFFETEFTWTELGDLADLTYPSCVIAQDGECTGNPGPSLTVTHTYTNAFLTAISGWASSIGYHPNEMLASVVHANGVTDLWDEDPDAMRRPARIRTQGVSGGSELDTGTYLYDGAGNVKAMGADSFGYDHVSRLIIGTASQGQLLETNEYDAFGNRIAATTSNVGSRAIPTDTATNRLLGTEDRPVAYDDRGNVVQWGTAVYERDPFDMIVRHDDGSLDLTYVYTADDERIITIVHPPSAVSESWILRDLDGKVLRRFFRSPSVDATWQKDTILRQGQVLATEDGAGRRDAHLDHLGTIRLWTGPGGGSPTHHTYHAFGEEVLDVQDGQVLRFTGHERDIYRSGGCSGTTVIDGQTLDEGETFVGCDEITSQNTTVTSSEEVRFKAGDRISLGNDFGVVPGAVFTAELDGYLNSDLQDLDYMHARHCSPGLGRFLSVDPVGGNSSSPQTWNRFTYALGNPIKYVDPFGLFPCPGLPHIECDDEITVIGEAPKFNPLTGVQGLQDLILARSGLLARAAEPPISRDFALEVITQVARDTGAISQATAITVDFLVGDSPLEVGLALAPAGKVAGKLGQVAVRNLTGGRLTAAQALKAAERWLGKGYKEIAPGVFRSADDTRQFRMTVDDLVDGRHGPHVHFESVASDGRTILENSHVQIAEP